MNNMNSIICVAFCFKAPSDAFTSDARDRNMERARKNTLKMTISIVVTFVLCWTPYAVIVMWYQIHWSSAEAIPGWLTSALFIFAFSSSCLNPFLHSRHLLDFRDMCGARLMRPQQSIRNSTFNENLEVESVRVQSAITQV